MNYINFSDALNAMKDGKRVSRKIWNDSNTSMYLYLVKSSVVSSDKLRNEAAKQPITDGNGFVKFNSHIDMKTADGSIDVGWVPSQSDIWAMDWYIVE